MRRTLASLVEEFRRWGEATAVVRYRGNRSYRTSYGAMARMAGRFAAELLRREVGPGERVVVWGENGAEWVAVFFGCVLRGVIAVPLDAAGTAEFARRVVGEVRPALLVGDRGLLRQMEGVEQIAFKDLDGVLPEEPVWVVSETVTEETPFQIVFTSGTTSEPKGIVHTHGNVLASLRPIEREIRRYRRYERLVHPLRFLHTLPLSHVFGQFMGLWVPALLGAEVHFEGRMEPARLLYEGQRAGVNVLVGVPRVLEMLRGHLLAAVPGLGEEVRRSERLPAAERWWRFRRVHRMLGWRWWAMVAGGATLNEEVEQFWAALGMPVIQGYGMTETAALVTLNHPFRVGRGTLGETLPGREVRLGEDGEILVRGAMLSGATWRGGTIEPREEEWLRTGDLADRDAAGELRFRGRKGDVIVTAAGMNVHPADVERVLARQAGVRGCVVVGCEAEAVATVLFGGTDAELAEAVRRTNAELAGYQQVRRVVRWPEFQFPMTSTGKLLRRRVAERVCGELLAVSGAAAAAKVEDALLRLVGEVTRRRVPAGAEDGLRLSEDLGLDSLGGVELAGALEQRMGVEVSDAAVARAATVGELRRLVEAAGMGRGVAGAREMLQGEATAVHGTMEGRAGAVATATKVTAAKLERVGQGRAVRYPRWPWWRPVRWVRGVFVEAVVRPLVRLLGAPRMEREGRLPDGPVLLVANHATVYDGALVLAALPGRMRRRVAIAMSGEVMAEIAAGQWAELPVGRWVGWLVVELLRALFDVFPLPRMGGFRRSFQHAGEAMDRGLSVLVFPEGRRSGDGQMLPFRGGVGLLAKECRAPVVPVAVGGLGAIKEGRVGWFRSGRLVVRVGAAVEWVEGRSAEEWVGLLEGAVRGLLGDGQS